MNEVSGGSDDHRSRRMWRALEPVHAVVYFGPSLPQTSPWSGRRHLTSCSGTPRPCCREQRGDGHVAALLTAGLDPVEALVLFAADHAMDTEWLRRRRGWSEEEWSDAAHRLSERGLLGEGALTPAGRTVRAEVEARTDALANPPVAAIGAAAADRLVELVTPLVTAIVGAGGFLATNPMGLRPLVPTR